VASSVQPTSQKVKCHVDECLRKYQEVDQGNSSANPGHQSRVHGEQHNPANPGIGSIPGKGGADEDGEGKLQA